VVPRKTPPLICIVDEDESVRQRLDRLIRSTGAHTSVFGSSHAFLHSYHSRPIRCLLLDAHLSGVSGVELQRMLGDAHIVIPIVLMTASTDVVRTGGLAHGAVEVLRKPFSDEEFLSVITALVSSARDSV
jgi:FixJ family two-component response regulator